MKIGIVQMNTQKDKTKNLAVAENLIDTLAQQGARLIVFPEHFNFRGPERLWRKNSEILEDSTSLAVLRNKALELGVYIHCGSILEREGDNLYNTGAVLDPQGEIISIYRKIHLFDVEVPGGRKYFESETITAGQDIVTFTIDRLTFGMATCYDLRFPELFRQLAFKGVDVVILPAAFTMMTGKDHWELLLRARAVENLCYVVAADQYGSSPPDNVSFGRSMIIDPWGVVLAQAADGVGTIAADIDSYRLQEIRQTFPALSHIREHLFTLPASKQNSHEES